MPEQEVDRDKMLNLIKDILVSIFAKVGGRPEELVKMLNNYGIKYRVEE